MTALPPGALSIPDAAAYLGISRRTLYRISAECGNGSGLKVVHIRGRRVFRVADLDAYLERQVVVGGQRQPAVSPIRGRRAS